MTTGDRRRSAGEAGERAVEAYLVARGFDVIGRRVRLGALEIDLVARRDGLAVMVEVRTRGATSFEKPLASISRKKRETLLRAADRLWRERLVPRGDVDRMRIDVAGVSWDADGAPRVDYVEGAIVGDGA